MPEDSAELLQITANNISDIKILAHPVYLQVMQVKFVYEGQWFKFKVTGRKSIFPQCKTSVGNNSGCIKT